jgi:hypothetical protein
MYAQRQKSSSGMQSAVDVHQIADDKLPADGNLVNHTPRPKISPHITYYTLMRQKAPFPPEQICSCWKRVFCTHRWKFDSLTGTRVVLSPTLKYFARARLLQQADPSRFCEARRVYARIILVCASQVWVPRDSIITIMWLAYFQSRGLLIILNRGMSVAPRGTRNQSRMRWIKTWHIHTHARAPFATEILAPLYPPPQSSRLMPPKASPNPINGKFVPGEEKNSFVEAQRV